MKRKLPAKKKLYVWLRTLIYKNHVDYDEHIFEVEVMAVVGIHAMVRRKGAAPFVADSRCLARDVTIDDGYGSTWSSWCSDCGQASMQVYRPGDVRCPQCYDKQSLKLAKVNNSK